MNNTPRLEEIYEEMLEEGFFDRVGSRLKGFGAGAKQLGSNIKNFRDPSKQQNVLKVAGNARLTNVINNFISKVKSERDSLSSNVGDAINNYPELSAIYTNLDRTITGLENIKNPSDKTPAPQTRSAEMEETPAPVDLPDAPPTLPSTDAQKAEAQAQTRSVDPDVDREPPPEVVPEPEDSTVTPETRAEKRAREAAELEAEIQANEKSKAKTPVTKPVRKPVAKPVRKPVAKVPAKKVIKSSLNFAEAYDSLMGNVKVL